MSKRPLRVSLSVAIGCRIRPAKNFLGVLNRTSRRLGIRSEESLVARSLHRQTRQSCLDGASPDSQIGVSPA